VTKSGSPEPVQVGHILEYTIIVSNTGPHAAGDITLTDPTPVNGMWVSFAGTAGGVVHVSSNMARADIGYIPAGGIWRGSLKVRPNAEGQITNTVTISSAYDSTPDNNVAIVTNTVIAGAFPNWWLQGLILVPGGPTNDYAAANQGQLKWIAERAYLEMQARLTGGAGATVSNLVNTFQSTNNYQAVNLGQLKATAKPFYDRLGEIHGETNYPWTATTADDNDFGAANVGQIKKAFSFEISE